MLTAFIGYFLSDYEAVSAGLIKTIGGPIDFAESFDIYIWQIGRDDFEIEFNFRGIKKLLDVAALRQFIHS